MEQPTTEDYFRMMRDSDNMPKIEVTEEEFVKLLISDHEFTQEKAERQLKIAKILGSRICVGGKMVGIKKRLEI